MGRKRFEARHNVQEWKERAAKKAAKAKRAETAAKEAKKCSACTCKVDA